MCGNVWERASIRAHLLPRSHVISSVCVSDGSIVTGSIKPTVGTRQVRETNIHPVWVSLLQLLFSFFGESKDYLDYAIM